MYDYFKNQIPDGSKEIMVMFMLLNNSGGVTMRTTVHPNYKELDGLEYVEQHKASPSIPVFKEI